jgi:hypothetical protein
MDLMLNLFFRDLDLSIFLADLVGRKYVRAVSTTKNPAESEIIINVPLALKIMTGYLANFSMAGIK